MTVGAIMIRLPILLTALALSAGAMAQPRPSTLAMTCSQAASLVQARGGIVLGTGGQTYDRFVAHRGFCQPTEAIKRAFVPTRDMPACLVGYRCFEPSGDDFLERF